jgi:hypothetical protein
MHSWREMVKLPGDGRPPGVVGYQADMAHSMLYTLGYNREQDRILPEGLRLERQRELDAAYKKVADALRPVDAGLPRRPERRHGVRLRRPREDRAGTAR